MSERFFTSTEAAEITRCTRRQLQYWREKGIVMPTVNPSGKGKNVYYSLSDLIALTTMEHLLGLGLSFETCQTALQTLKKQEPNFFMEQRQFNKELMVVPTRDKLTLSELDRNSAWEAIRDGYAVVPFRTERIYRRLEESLDISAPESES